MKKIKEWYFYNFKYELGKKKEALMIKIAWAMPRWLVCWCSIRLISKATVGEYGHQVVPELTAMDALKRWER